MLEAYRAIRDQIAQDVATAWPGVPVSFGRQTKAFRAWPQCVVVCPDVMRPFSSPRAVMEEYRFLIQLQQAKTAVMADVEAWKIEMAQALGALLAPSDDAAVPTPAGLYAGVAYNRRVTLVDLVQDDERDAADYWQVVLEFRCEADVYQ